MSVTKQQRNSKGVIKIRYESSDMASVWWCCRTLAGTISEGRYDDIDAITATEIFEELCKIFT